MKSLSKPERCRDSLRFPQHPKSETFVTTPGDAEQSTKRQRQEVTFREPQQTSSSSGAVADTSVQIPDPQIPKPARPLSRAERENSYQKRERPADVKTVLAIAGGESRIEILTKKDDQNALHTAKVNELLNLDKCGVVEVFDRPQSQQVLSTRWVSKQRLDGSYKVRVVARGSELERQSSRLCAHFSRSLQFTEIQMLLEIVTVHFINHRCQVNQNQCMWSQPRKHSWTLPWYGFARKLFKDSRFLLRPEGSHRTEKINDMSYNQLISDSSTYVKKLAQRSDDSILLRHTDDVVGTGPDEHLMSDF